MRRFMFLLILLTFLTGTATTEAATWVITSTSPTRALVVYIDTSSITTGPDGSKEAWIKHEITPPDCKLFVGKCLSHTMTYHRFYPNKTSCLIEGTFYFTSGPESDSSPSCKPKKITPESFDEINWEYLFRGRGDEKTQ